MIATFLLLAAAPASRTIDIGTFERLRVDGPVEVRVIAGASPHASVTGDPRAIDSVTVDEQGTTVSVRRAIDHWTAAPRPGGEATPLVVTLSTPDLTGVTIIAGGVVAVAGRVHATRVDLSLTGAGSLSVAGIDAEQLNATVLGQGQVTLAGRSNAARITGNGPVSIDASGLAAGTLAVRMDGPGTVTAAARYQADVSSTGLGRITVAGSARCTVRAPAGSPIACGAGPDAPGS